MVIQHNLQAANANRMLGIVTSKQSNSVKKLSSGYRINSAADDAAGLSISEKMRHQIRGLGKAANNAQDGISLIQVAEGALSEVHSILHRINELATQAANDTNTSIDRDAIKNEIDQLAVEIDRVASATQFNSMNLIDGTFRRKNLQVGSHSGQRIEIDIKAMDTHALGLSFDFKDARIDDVLATKPSIEFIEQNRETDTAYPGWGSTDIPTGRKSRYNPSQNMLVNSFEMASRSMIVAQNAVNLVSEMRSELGATQNRLEHTISNLNNIEENTAAAESRIRDTDMAEEMVTYSTNNILAQAGQTMLAQANQSSPGVLSHLQ